MTIATYCCRHLSKNEKVDIFWSKFLSQEGVKDGEDNNDEVDGNCSKKNDNGDKDTDIAICDSDLTGIMLLMMVTVVVMMDQRQKSMMFVLSVT